MGTPKLTTPRIYVVMPDGAEFTIQAVNDDLVAFERDQAKHQWPGPTDAPLSWMTYVAWHHLTHEGLLPMVPLKDFHPLQVSAPDDDQADVDPTDPGPDPG